MRKIKFRCWDKACKCYAENWKLYLNGGVSICGTWATKDVVLEQYTGFKDKNSKEIYDGDIVQYTHRRISEFGIESPIEIALVKWDCDYFTYVVIFEPEEEQHLADFCVDFYVCRYF